MPVTNYDTINGQMIGYHASGVQKDFLTDALGSVTAEVDQTGNTKTFDGRYKPYGGDLSSTGTRGAFGWVGTWGYKTTGLDASSHYIRRRHYSSLNATWTTIDPIWPDQGSYNYVISNPTLLIDPSGFCVPDDSHCCCCPSGGFVTHKRLKGTLKVPYFPPGIGWTAARRLAWRGHSVDFHITLTFFKSTKKGAGCADPVDFEEAYLNGTKVKGLSFKESGLYDDWLNCLKKKPKDCKGSIKCVINDLPGVSNKDPNGFPLPTDLKLKKILTFKGSKACNCKDVPLRFDQHIKWTKYTVDPDIWDPKDNK